MLLLKNFGVTGKFLQCCSVYEYWEQKQPAGRNDHPHFGSELGGRAKIWCAENFAQSSSWTEEFQRIKSKWNEGTTSYKIRIIA